MNESETSTRRGNFLDLVNWYADRKEDVKKVVLENAPQNDIMICPNSQKDIVNSCAKETLKAIVEDLNGDYFGILVDESKDSLKDAICSLLLEHNLSSSHIWGQDYDGASNMQGEFNGLKTLIMKDNPSAYSVHCFSHQLQLTLVVVAKKHHEHKEMLRDDQIEKLEELFMLGEVHTGNELNQELGLHRARDTHWSSHFKTVYNFIKLFSLIIHVLEVVSKKGSNYKEKSLAKSLVEDIRSYEFMYTPHSMLKVLAITHDFIMALQRKDQDIVTAMNLVGFTKRQLQSMRDSKWDSLVKDVSLFCAKHDIVILKMNKNYSLGKSKRKISSIIYSHHFHVKIFNVVIDLQLGELNSHFDEVNTDLLLDMASFNPDNPFVNYDKNRIIKLATYYPDEFSASMLEDLNFELDNYIDYVRQGNNDFSKLKRLGDLSETLVKTNLHKTWKLVYLLVKLSLILSVAIAMVERAFSSMKYIKNDLRSRIGDEFLNDCLVCYIEDEVFETVHNEAIIDHFQNMTSRQYNYNDNVFKYVVFNGLFL
ncbi:zinc finger MYM-type protein 1-like [Capsicum annuum]|uniref:zinc finger MYM-type protein 1-like n=1 Tax=Capsicum annuum TaxID=4072 RepID=UPI001FB14EA4|nr:zinc finger MYM-type protein 1-like [Capsicum annuum]